jgi:predicted Zn-dependent protease
MAAQWDDDGCVPTPHTLIQDGMLVDYHTDGQTVGALKDYYQQQGKALRPNGCATVDEAHQAVRVVSPHLVMTPATTRTSLSDLCRDITKGVVMLYQNYSMATDQGLSSASMHTGTNGPDGAVFEVARGKIVRRVKGMMLQFNTVPFFKGITALGDATTARQGAMSVSGNDIPWTQHWGSADTPASSFREINVVAAR